MLTTIRNSNSESFHNLELKGNRLIFYDNQKIPQMKIKHILEGFSNPPLDLVQETLNQEIEPLKIETINWEEYSYKPEVTVQIAYNSEELFLQYKVSEQSVKAEIVKNNGRVWTDSCVEFFLSPEGNDVYYNLEVNCIGTALLGFRKKGDATQHAEDNIIDNIRRLSSLGTKTFKERKELSEWNITIAIPWKTFFMHNINACSGLKMRGNFYKCGDELTVPHFLSWTKIKTDKPSFHQPEFFGGLELE